MQILVGHCRAQSFIVGTVGGATATSAVCHIDILAVLSLSHRHEKGLRYVQVKQQDLTPQLFVQSLCLISCDLSDDEPSTLVHFIEALEVIGAGSETSAIVPATSNELGQPMHPTAYHTSICPHVLHPISLKQVPACIVHLTRLCTGKVRPSRCSISMCRQVCGNP